MVLVDNLDKLHTTPMGEERIIKNLTLDVPDAIAWCKEKVFGAVAIIRKGRNWYAYIDDVVITINAHSYTVITVHKSKVNVREITPADYPLLEDFIDVTHSDSYRKRITVVGSAEGFCRYWRLLL